MADQQQGDVEARRRDVLRLHGEFKWDWLDVVADSEYSDYRVWVFDLLTKINLPMQQLSNRPIANRQGLGLYYSNLILNPNHSINKVRYEQIVLFRLLVEFVVNLLQSFLPVKNHFFYDQV